jgi:hypothetical protein
MAGNSTALQIYHRDNPASMTNLIRISRKTVFTYARLIDMFDIYYLRRPLLWLAHLIVLIKFSMEVHNNPIYHHRYIGSIFIKALSFLLLPLGMAHYFYSRGRYTIVDFPEYPLSALPALKNCHE